MKNRIQIWNHFAKSWSIIDTDTGCIIDRSENPVEGIKRVARLGTL